jgi:hypothetical protein
MGIRKLTGDRKNLYRLILLMLSIFVLEESNVDREIVLMFGGVCCRICMAIGRYFSFSCGFEQMDRKILLASTWNIAPHWCLTETHRYQLQPSEPQRSEIRNCH